MKTKLEFENKIVNRFNVKYKEIDLLPRRESSGYSSFSKTWATAVSIDIVGFKKMVDPSSNINMEQMVKIVQLFNEIVAEVAMSELFKHIFRDIYYVGDEVIVVFNSSTKEQINEAVDFAFYMNSLINTVLSKKLISLIPNLNYFKAGIGVWTSNDNTLVRSGKKGDLEYSSSTLIGTSINYASKLSKMANRYPYDNYPILLSGLAKGNLYNTMDDIVSKHAQELNTNIGRIWGVNLIKTAYN